MKPDTALKNKTTALLLISLACSFGNAQGEGEKQLPFENWIAIQSKFHEGECGRYTQIHKLSSLELRDTNNAEKYEHARSGMEFFCGCAPAAMNTYSDTLSLYDRSRSVSFREFINIVTPAISNQCIAAHVRSRAYESCIAATFQLPDGVTNRETFCRCVSVNIKSMEDKSIINAAEAAQTKLDDTSKTLRGESVLNLVGRSNGLTDQILKECSNH